MTSDAQEKRTLLLGLPAPRLEGERQQLVLPPAQDRFLLLRACHLILVVDIPLQAADARCKCCHATYKAAQHLLKHIIVSSGEVIADEAYVQEWGRALVRLVASSSFDRPNLDMSLSHAESVQS